MNYVNAAIGKSAIKSGKPLNKYTQICNTMCSTFIVNVIRLVKWETGKPVNRFLNQ